MVGALIFLIVLSSGILKLVYDHQLSKDMEKTIRYNDRQLGDFWYESKTERNDGWIKMHYEGLYHRRLEELRNNRK